MTFILIQIMRMPQVLKMAECVSKETWGDSINTKQAQNIARIICLPFFKEIEEGSKEIYIFDTLFEPMKNMSFGVGVDRERKIITSDKPVYVCAKNVPCDEYDEIVLPISSELCLFLFGRENKSNYHKNFLFPINDEIRKEILKSMTASSFGKLYSNHILDKTERRYIKEVLKENVT